MQDACSRDHARTVHAFVDECEEVLLLLMLAVLGVQSFFDLPFQLRFKHSLANYGFVALAWLMFPLLLFWLARKALQKWQRTVAGIAAGVVVLPCLVASGCS
jgi:hypothetical protein